MQSNKITTQLEDFLKEPACEEEITVVIELIPGAPNISMENTTRHQKMASLKQSFYDELQPVAREISNQGGNIVDSAWLNQTVKAKVPAGSIMELARLKEISAIDLPHRLTRD